MLRVAWLTSLPFSLIYGAMCFPAGAILLASGFAFHQRGREKRAQNSQTAAGFAGLLSCWPAHASLTFVTLGTSSGTTARTRYDEINWPFVIITLPPRELTEHEFQDNLRRMDEYAARGDNFGFVLDTRGAPDPDAPRRRAIAEYWDACLRRHGDMFVGAAIVMSSSSGRAVFKAILWLRQNPQRLIPVATTEEGLERLRAFAPKAV